MSRSPFTIGAEQQLRLAAKSRGWSRKGTVAWRKATSLMHVLRFYKSRWDSAIYVECELSTIFPTKRNGAPSIGDFGCKIRACNITGPHQQLFFDIGLNDWSQVQKDGWQILVPAFEWCMDWMAENFDDETQTKAKVLSGELGKLGLLSLRLKEWAGWSAPPAEVASKEGDRKKPSLTEPTIMRFEDF